MSKHNALLVVTSLLAILLLTLHVTDDIVRGISKAEPSNSALLVVAICLAGSEASPPSSRRADCGV
jgi:hypothetical protein